MPRAQVVAADLAPAAVPQPLPVALAPRVWCQSAEAEWSTLSALGAERVFLTNT